MAYVNDCLDKQTLYTSPNTRKLEATVGFSGVLEDFN
jgi:hypothetical protein